MLAVYVGKLPYKKLIAASVEYYEENNESVLRVEITNVGRVPIIISDIRIRDWLNRDVAVFNTRADDDNHIFAPYCKIEAGKTIVRQAVVYDNNYLRKHSINMNYRFHICIKDAEGKKYRIIRGYPVG